MSEPQPKGMQRSSPGAHFIHTFKVCTAASTITERKWEEGLVALGDKALRSNIGTNSLQLSGEPLASTTFSKGEQMTQSASGFREDTWKAKQGSQQPAYSGLQGQPASSGHSHPAPSRNQHLGGALTEENLRVGPNSSPSSVQEGQVYSPRGQPNLASYGLFWLPLL